MMSNRSRGATYEREVAKELEAEIGFKFQRDLDQVRTAGRADLITDAEFPFVIECKRRKSGQYNPAWMGQAQTAATTQYKLPAVIFRFDYQKSQVAMPTYAVGAAFGWGNDYAEMQEPMFTSIPNFCALVREML
jgi:hypothetical protein